MDSIPDYACQALKERLEIHTRTAWAERCAGANV